MCDTSENLFVEGVPQSNIVDKFTWSVVQQFLVSVMAAPGFGIIDQLHSSLGVVIFGFHHCLFTLWIGFWNWLSDFTRPREKYFFSLDTGVLKKLTDPVPESQSFEFDHEFVP